MSASRNGVSCFLRAARRRSVLVGGLKVSAVVGTLLNAINQWPGWLDGAAISLPHLLLNYLVPFGVSVFSAARFAMRESADASTALNETAGPQPR